MTQSKVLVMDSFTETEKRVQEMLKEKGSVGTRGQFKGGYVTGRIEPQFDPEALAPQYLAIRNMTFQQFVEAVNSGRIRLSRDFIGRDMDEDGNFIPTSQARKSIHTMDGHRVTLSAEHTEERSLAGKMRMLLRNAKGRYHRTLAQGKVQVMRLLRNLKQRKGNGRSL